MGYRLDGIGPDRLAEMGRAVMESHERTQRVTRLCAPTGIERLMGLGRAPVVSEGLAGYFRDIERIAKMGENIVK